METINGKHPTDSEASPVRISISQEPAFRVFMVAIVVRVAYLVSYVGSPFHGYYHSDYEYYLTWAKAVAAGDLFADAAFEQGPLYPYAVGLLFSLVGEQTELLLFLQCVFGAGACVLVFLCGTRLFSVRVGLIAGYAASLYGPLVFYDCNLLKAFLSPLLTIAALFFALEHRDSNRLISLACASFIIGLSCLVRENHILMLLVLMFGCLWRAYEMPSTDKWFRRWVLPLAMVIVPFAVALLPSTIHNYLVGGEFVPVTTGGGEVLYIAQGPHATGYYNPPPWVTPHPRLAHDDFREEARRRTGEQLSQGQADQYWRSQAIAAILKQPLRALRLVGKKAVILVNNYEVADTEDFGATRRIVPPLLVLPTFGFVVGLATLSIIQNVTRIRELFLLYGFGLAHVATILLIYNYGRFRMGCIPIAILFAAQGGSDLFDRIMAWRQGKGPLPLLNLGVVAAVTLISFLPITPVGYRIGELLTVANLSYQDDRYADSRSFADECLKKLASVSDRDPGVAKSLEYSRWKIDAESILGRSALMEGDTFSAVQAFEDARQVPSKNRLREAIFVKNLEVMLSRFLAMPSQARGYAELEAEIFRHARILHSISDTPHLYALVCCRTAYDANRVADCARVLKALPEADGPFSVACVEGAKAFLALKMGNRSDAMEMAQAALSQGAEIPFAEDLRSIAAR